MPAIELSSALALAQSRDAQRRRDAAAGQQAAEANKQAGQTTSPSAPGTTGDVTAAAQAPRLERGARSLGVNPSTANVSAPPLPGETTSAAPAKTVAPTAANEAAKNAVGFGLEVAGQAYQSIASKNSKVTTRTLMGRAAHAVGEALPPGRAASLANRAGDFLAKSAAKVTKTWGFTSHIANYGFSAAVRATGGVISTAADIVQNGVPKHAREVGALITKNAVTGVAAGIGGLVVGAGAGALSGGALAAPGAIAGAVAAGQSVDGRAGRLADWLWGTNRYAAQPPSMASAVPAM